jgi:nitrite reductase (NADH) small subunit
MSSERKEHVLGDLSDFPVGTHRVVKVGRREIGVFNIGGKLYGLPNVCPHQTGPLCEGKPPWAPWSPGARTPGSSSG